MNAPQWLADLQREFAQSIREPLEIESDGFRCRYEAYQPSVVRSMREREGLAGVSRLSTYNQQYWFRLLTVFQTEFPLLCRLLGLRELNRLTTAAIHKFPSQHPELHHLPPHLIRYLDTESPWSTDANRLAARVDLAYFSAFLAEKYQDIRAQHMDPETIQALLTQPLRFQASWSLITESYNAIETRRAATAPPSDLPTVTLQAKRANWAIFRGPRGVTEIRLGDLQAALLQRLERGESLVDACDALQQTLDHDDLEFLATNIQGWFQHWAQLGWFAASDL